LAQANLMLANILLDLGQWPEAESAALEAVCHFGAVAETDPAERAGLAAAHRTLSQLFSNRGQPTVALGHVQKAHDLREKISAEKPDDFEARWHLAAAQRDLSNQLTSLNRLDEAEKLVRRNLESRLKLAKEQPWNDAIQFSLAGAYGTLGVIQSRRDDSALPGSVDAFRQALTILDSVIAASPGTAVYRFEKLVALGNLSTVLTRQGKNAEALTIACAAVEIGRKLVSDFPLQLSLRMRLTAALNSLALATSDQGKHAEAEELYREAIGHHEWIARRVPDSVEEQVHFGGVYCNLSLLQSETGRAREGVVSSDRAIALLQPAAARTPPAAMAKRFLGNSYLARSQAREMIGDQKGALADVDAAIEQHGVSVSTSLRRAVLLARLGQLETALTIADDIVRINKLPPAFLVQAARVYALAGVDDADSRQRALDLLKKAASAGFRAGTAVTSTDFDSLSTEQAWPALRESLQTGRRNDA
jgi:tetratricopeptide (TPR) repeat protein